MAAFEVDQKLKTRKNGLFEQLYNIRVKDRLNILVTSGIIDKKHIVSWSEARNKGGHAAKLGVVDFSGPKLQAALTKVLTVQTLINQLIFVLIGCSGPFVNYGKFGYPRDIFVCR